MGNFLCCFTTINATERFPIDTDFMFSSPLPSWPPGEGFANGTIDLGGLQVRQITSFTKIWSSSDDEPDDINGASFFEPSPIPDGFSMLGCYCQSNATPLFGWVLAGKDVSGQTLASPVEYTLVLSVPDSCYIWLPIPPDGYNPVGYAITSSSEKPPLDQIKCVRADLTDECETDVFLWRADNGAMVSSLRPKTRGAQAQGVCVGTFNVEDENNSYSILSCLKNNNFNMLSSTMPNLDQIKALVQEYSPRLYFHPKEIYLPSSTTWYFSNGVQLYHAGDESNPIPVEPTGSNLPQGGSNDGTYWLDLPVDEAERERVKKGDLQTCEVYIHVKPMLGATFSDIVIWIFYPFNGPSTAKLGLIDVPLGKIGEHVGDWEHVTMRISNFSGVLYRVYFAQHSGGRWVDTASLEFQNGTNHFIGYSSLHGHATYHVPGVVFQGTDVVGIRNDTAKSEMFLDVGATYSIMAVDYIDSVIEPPWLNYARKWGPKITYEIGAELEKLENSSRILKSAIESLLEILPTEVYEEDGPTGPKMKEYWDGDER